MVLFQKQNKLISCYVDPMELFIYKIWAKTLSEKLRLAVIKKDNGDQEGFYANMNEEEEENFEGEREEMWKEEETHAKRKEKSSNIDLIGGKCYKRIA